MNQARGAVLIKLLVVGTVTVLGTAAIVHHQLDRKDRAHHQFYEAGRTLNHFLSQSCAALLEAQAQGDPAPLLGLYTEGNPRPEPWQWTAAEPVGDVLRQTRKTQPTPGSSGPAPLDTVLGEELASFAAIDHAVCKINLIEELEPRVWARLTVKRFVDGVDPQGRVFQERQFFRWHVENTDPGEGVRWRIQREELVEGVRVLGDRQTLIEVDPQRLGIDFEHRRDPQLHRSDHSDTLRFGVIQHSSGGVTAADYDGDGRPDLLFLDGQRSRLYRNEGPGDDGLARFRDVTREEGLEGIGSARSALFADFDNDGDRDLFIARYLESNLYFENTGRTTPQSAPAQGSRFVEQGAALGLDAVLPSTSVTVTDFDRDGFLDLYVAVFGNAFEAVPRLPFFATNGGANRLYRNDGGQGFVDVTDATGTGDTGWSLAVASTDVDGDGWPDLAVANDFGRKTLLHNDGPDAEGRVTFTDRAKSAGVLDFSGGMGLVFGDLDTDGRPDLYTSNINSNQRWFGEDITVTQYLRNILRSRWALADAGEYWKLYQLLGSRWSELGKQVGEGNSVFRNLGPRVGAEDEGPHFEEVRDSHAERAGWGWGVALLDLDNDRDLDIYAANGWISDTPGTDL